MGCCHRPFNVILAFLLASVPLVAQQEPLALTAASNGKQFDRAAAAMQRVLKAWLGTADPRTLLLPDRLPGGLRGNKPGDMTRLYTPHNSGADLYPYLILTARLTDPDLYHGRMLEMLRNEVRYTTVKDSLPANLDLTTGEIGPPSLFGAAEYAKDGLLAVTELLGRTPWFHRMTDLIIDLMKHAPVATRWGNLPGAGSEINGDVLQVLVRLATMTNDPRFRQWGRRIGDAYIEEVLPGNHGLPPEEWNFEEHTGTGSVRLRDHGNEAIVGLTLLYAIEEAEGTERARSYRPVIGRMLDRVLESANTDGMLYSAIDAETLKPVSTPLSDNWGYVYGAVYTFYQVTGEAKYRDAVRRVLAGLPKYRGYDWERGSFDGVADSVESALYLAAREPVPEALDWIESEVADLIGRQQPDGFLENWYGEGNFNRTLLLYALYKSQGCRPEQWFPGLELGAVPDGDGVRLSLRRRAKIQFDFARHRRVMGFDKDYVRLNEFPEWFTVEENHLYRLRPSEGKARILLGSELIAGVVLEPGDWRVEPLGAPPYNEKWGQTHLFRDGGVYPR